MAATYSKPAKIPRWADTTAWILEPPSGKKDLGWEYKEAPASTYENWIQKLTGDWFKWINERLFDGTTEDTFVINQPSLGVNALRFIDAAGSPAVEIAGGLLRFDTSETLRKIGFDGANNPSDWFGYDEDYDVFRTVQAGVDVISAGAYFSLFFADPETYPDAARGMFLFSYIAPPYSNMFVFSTSTNTDYPTVEYDETENAFNFALAKPTVGYPVGNALANFSIDEYGNLLAQNPGTDPYLGGSLTFKQGDTDHSYKIYHSLDELSIASYNGAVLEKLHLQFSGSNDEVLFDSDAELIPGGAVLSGKIGTASSVWEEGHFGTLFQSSPPYYYAEMSGDNLINTATEENCTPTVDLITPNLLDVDAYGLVANYEGKYRATWMLRIDVAANTQGDPIAARLYKENSHTGRVLQESTVCTLPGVSGYHTITLSYLLDFQDAGPSINSDAFSFWVYNNTGNDVTVLESSKLTVTPVGIYE